MESLCQKEIPKTTARSVQVFKEPIPIQTTNRFDPLKENAVLDTERWIPCKSSHLSHTGDRILSQGGEKSNLKCTWRSTKTSAKSFENKAATNEDDHFAETMNWETAKGEISVVPGKHLY